MCQWRHTQIKWRKNMEPKKPLAHTHTYTCECWNLKRSLKMKSTYAFDCDWNEFRFHWNFDAICLHERKQHIFRSTPKLNRFYSHLIAFYEWIHAHTHTHRHDEKKRRGKTTVIFDWVYHDDELNGWSKMKLIKSFRYTAQHSRWIWRRRKRKKERKIWTA